MSESTNGAYATQRQLAMVFNLDKCIGCQTCTVTCRTHWKVDRPGADHLFNLWVETKPGAGWPKDWMEIGRKKPNWVRDYGGTWEFNIEEVYNSPAGETYLHPRVKETGEHVNYGPVWDEDRGGGEWPNGYFFYMPRMCNHCDDPVCVTACDDYCTRHDKPVAMTKREKDGIVQIDPDLCLDCHMCIAACPYQVPMENVETKTNEGVGAYEMCDFCASRVDNDFAPVCAKSCPARATYFGYLDDEDSHVHKLVHKYKVALPLRPDFETGPNVYYIPPFIRPNKVGEHFEILDEKDLPIELLREYFGPGVDDALATLKEHRDMAARGEDSELMDMLILYDFADGFKPFEVLAPTDSFDITSMEVHNG